MRIVEITPEAVPFVKTGGLADVAGALPEALRSLGHEVSVFLPFYRPLRNGPWRAEPAGPVLRIPVGRGVREAAVVRLAVPHSRVAWYAIACDALYDRDGLYGDGRGDHPDNAERFVVFARAALEAAEALGLAPDVLHAHDWQAGLVPVYARTLYRDRPAGRARTVLTVHNLAYQGLFWHWDLPITGLDWAHFNWRELEFHGKIGFLKGGLVFADALTTVSPRYAEEIQTTDYGCGLEGVLRHRTGAIRGILNGIDGQAWDPQTDPHLPAHYGRERPAGKAVCKRRLQERLGLPVRSDVPLLAFVGRLVEQKGLDLMEAVLPALLERDVQLAVLGTGHERYHLFLEALQVKFPERVGLFLGFDEPLAHQIEGGGDIFLMPSRFEPCGLNQMYSLRYGTVPVVRETGGLADTVTDCRAETLAAGTANGFMFRAYRVEEFRRAVERAVAAYADGDLWRRLMRTGMARDDSWLRRAGEYVEVFQGALDRPAAATPAAR